MHPHQLQWIQECIGEQTYHPLRKKGQYKVQQYRLMRHLHHPWSPSYSIITDFFTLKKYNRFVLMTPMQNVTIISSVARTEGRCKQIILSLTIDILLDQPHEYICLEKHFTILVLLLRYTNILEQNVVVEVMLLRLSIKAVLIFIGGRMHCNTDTFK